MAVFSSAKMSHHMGQNETLGHYSGAFVSDLCTHFDINYTHHLLSNHTQFRMTCYDSFHSLVMSSPNQDIFKQI